MDLERDIKNIEEMISTDRIALAIKGLEEVLEKDSGSFFEKEVRSLLSLEGRFSKNERGFKQEGILDKKEYDFEDNRIRQGLIDIITAIKKNVKQLEPEVKTETSARGEDTFFNGEEETLVDKASKIVVLFLMGAAAILLIYFIAFHENEDTQLTGILASGGVVFVSLFKQTLDRYLKLRFS
ncbi:MAG: hypothetical protein R8P61_26210 [Bacteroidia bacterium]|nr:hypothetical protein [Bacteroidia bacterium]